MNLHYFQAEKLKRFSFFPENFPEKKRNLVSFQVRCEATSSDDSVRPSAACPNEPQGSLRGLLDHEIIFFQIILHIPRRWKWIKIDDFIDLPKYIVGAAHVIELAHIFVLFIFEV